VGDVVRLIGFVLAASTVWGQAAEAVRQSYNQMYKDTAKVFSTSPNSFLVRTVSGRKTGRALDVGMGQGRNALWLAEQGWDVTGIDISDEGVAQTRAEAGRRGLRVKAERVGYSEFAYGEAQWDLIVLCYFLPRDLPERLLRALKPGGLVVVEGFHSDTAFVRLLPGGLENNELIGLFPGLRVLQYEDVETPAEWGGVLGGGNRIVRLLAQRPDAKPPGCRFEGRPFQRGETVWWGNLKLRVEANGCARGEACENSGEHA